MKFMLMMHHKGDGPAITTWPPADIQAHIQFMKDLNQRLMAKGELVDAQGLAFPDQAKEVRAKKGGGFAVTDGPFPESKEFLAGFWIIDVASVERATELAAKVVRFVHAPIEIRPIGEAPEV